jgi:hypothetical protein
VTESYGIVLSMRAVGVPPCSHIAMRSEESIRGPLAQPGLSVAVAQLRARPILQHPSAVNPLKHSGNYMYHFNIQ